MRFNPKVLVLEDISDLDDLTKNELYRIITTYEMRTRPENISKKIVACKATWKPKSSRNKYRNTTNPLDEEEANFVRRPKRGKGKYQGKLSFVCFKCWRIGNFASKCTYEENRESESEEESEHWEWKEKHQQNKDTNKKKL